MAKIDLEKLKTYLAGKLGASDLDITNFWKNLEGWSMETFSLGLKYRKDGATVEKDIIIRKEPVSGLLEPYDVSVEYRVISAIKNAGVAVPETYWLEKDPAVLGLPFYVMEKVDGHVHFFSSSKMLDPTWKLIPDDAERISLGEDFVRNLSLIHNSDWKALGLDFLDDPGPGKKTGESEVRRWHEVISRAGFGKKPVVTYAKHWLLDNLPDNDKVRLVHGDYRTGNYICAGGKIKAVLDWEMVHLGDPMEDISYVISSVWRSPKPNQWVSHLMPEAEFYAKYEAASGIKIDKERIKFNHVLNNFKAVGIASTAGNAFKSKPNLDLKVGIFGMLVYAPLVNLMSSLNKYIAPAKKGAA